jgi:very-short-patch-repair endonuclease
VLNPTLDAVRNSLGDTGFFIKNIENVQGDERDVIMISTTYGPDESGRIHQNFGPINRAQGPRRLNVLFTRAKNRIELFSSMSPDQLRVENSPRGLQLLREYLSYARDGRMTATPVAGGEPDSDFERSVAGALRERGLNLTTQVGVAGYFIDLAVVDPKADGRYVLGIECDGATYHSSYSARDRDRLRQQALERLGWTIHRIWSRDWFRDDRREVEKIMAKVRELLAGGRGSFSASDGNATQRKPHIS